MCYSVVEVAAAGVTASLLAVRRAINRLTSMPTNMAVTVDKHISAIKYGSAVPITATNRMAARGALNSSPTVADSMHSTRIDTGIDGKSRLNAIAIIVQENKAGNVGPPRYPLLNDNPS